MSSSYRPIVPGSAEGLDDIVDQLLVGVPSSKNPPANPLGNTNFQNNAQFWTLDNVAYRNGVYTVDLSKALLDGGNGHTQDEWAKLYAQAKNSNDFHAPDYPLIYGIVKTLYNARNDTTKVQTIGEMHAFLKEKSRAHWLMTLTRISYRPQGNPDVIYHNFGTTDSYARDTDFTGKDDWIKNTSCTDAYRALLGTNDSITDINTVFHWLNGTDTRIWRLNSKPSKADARVAGLGAYSDRVGLGCDRGSAISDSALGVRLRKTS